MLTTTLFAMRKILRSALIVLSLTVLGAGILSARAITAKRGFSGHIKVQLCGKTQDGRWETFDTVDLSSVKFSVSLYELESQDRMGNITTRFTFNGRTEKGRQVSVRLLRPGKAAAKLTTGKVELELPIELSIEGKRFSLPLSLTTDTARLPDGGTISGRRATIDRATHAATLAMVGNASFTGPALNDALQLVSPKGNLKLNELLLAVQSEGRLTAADH